MNEDRTQKDDQTVQKPATQQVISQPTEQPQTVFQSTSPDKKSNKMLLVILAAGLVFLLMAGAIIALLMNGDSSTSSNQSSTADSSTNTSSTTPVPSKRIVKTVPFNEKLEYVIYEPKQNASNTTINFGVRNKCAGCEDDVYTGTATSGFDSRTGSYLVDDSAGKKYTVIKDEDDNVLASTSCTGSIGKNEVIDCFVSFKQVPSGSMVSWVFGKTRIDDIKIK